jgi:hypothetical protein
MGASVAGKCLAWSCGVSGAIVFPVRVLQKRERRDQLPGRAVRQAWIA